MKITRVFAALAIFVLMLATARGTDASPKLRFLKSKKFWQVAAAVAIPSATSGALASQSSSGVTLPRMPTTTTARPHR